MILYYVLFLGFLFTRVFGYFTEQESDADPGDFAMRFANIDFLQKDNTLVQLYFYQGIQDEGLLIPHVDYQDTISDFDKSKKTIVMFNGHPSADSEEPFLQLRRAFFETEPVNILYVYIDWTKHHITFLDAIRLADSLGQFVGDFLVEFSLQTTNYHFVGHCAGAEIGASVAKFLMQRTGRKIPIMTVFDPFVTNATGLLHADQYIDFIDVYHAGIYDPPFFPIGSVDFYPNAGVRQPGCEEINKFDILKKFICHHQRSIYLYIESMQTRINAVEAHFSVNQKNLMVKDNPQIATFGYMVSRDLQGAFYLPTYQDEPYLMNYF